MTKNPDIVQVVHLSTVYAASIASSIVEVKLPRHPTDIALILPNGQELRFQYRPDEPLIDITLPEGMIVTSMESKESNQPHSQLAGYVLIDLPEDSVKDDSITP